jgi:3-hydroxyisobutyrate dehydrogenase/2-hydroxy-3-oxopropionate reductase
VLAFCGLGQMGAPMAARLLEGGLDVTVWNRTHGKAAELVAKGAKQASTPAEAAAGADVVITMLTTPQVVGTVIFGPDGIAEALGERSTVIEMSTIGPSAVRAVRDRLPDTVGLLDAPVLGSVRQATEGQLKVFVGGDQEVFERCRPVFDRLGTPRHLGPTGAGASMKLVANLCLGVLMTGLGEALRLADGLGLAQADVLDVLAESAIGATVKSKRSNIESGEWPPNFKLALAAKDVRIVLEEAAAVGTDLPLAATAGQWLTAADEAGLGDRDYSAVIEKIRDSSAG